MEKLKSHLFSVLLTLGLVLIGSLAVAGNSSTKILDANGDCLGIVKGMVQEMACSTAPSFNVANIDANFLYIQTPTGNLCITNNGSASEGQQLGTKTCNISDLTQHFYFQTNYAGQYKIFIRGSGLSLTVRSPASNVPVQGQQWQTLTDSTHEVFSLTLPSTSFTSEKARMSDSFVDSMGVDTHLSYPAYSSVYTSIIRPRLQELGIRHIRDGGPMASSTTQNIASSYTTYNDLAKNLGIHATLVMSPIDGSCGQKGTASFGYLAPLFNAFSSAYIDALEGLNEMDANKNCSGGWVTYDRDFQDTMWNAMKSSSIKVPVLGPSMAQTPAALTIGSIVGAANYGNMHSYPGGGAPGASLIALAGLSPMNGTLTPYASETGYYNYVASGYSGVSEAASGRYIGRLFAEYFNANVLRTFIYEFFDEAGYQSSKPDQANYGLLRGNGSEKPAYVMMKNMIALLADPGATFNPANLEYSLSSSAPYIHHTLLQKRNGKFELILWNEIPSFSLSTQKDISNANATVTVKLGEQASVVSFYNPYISTTANTTLNSTTQFNVSVPDSPVIIEITLASSAQSFEMVSTIDTSMCVDILGNTKAVGNKADIYPCANKAGSNQDFTVVPVSNGIQLKVSNSQLCLQVQNTTLKGDLIQGDCYGINTVWTMVSHGSNYSFQSVRSGMCLDIPGAKPSKALLLDQYTCNSTNAQIFSLKYE